MKNFDCFVGIDWSGAEKPVHTPALAVAVCQGHSAPHLLKPSSHKHWSRTLVADWIKNLLKTNKRILIGIDANFGYAQSIGRRQFGPDYDYRDLWAAVEKSCQDQPNYFAGEYWKVWPDLFWTSGKQPAHMTFPKRLTEMVCGESGYGWPESPFKLIGAKQVGKGGLAAMRMAYDLKKTCFDKVAIWPFEQELAEDSAQIVITEIYPRLFLKRCGHGNAKVRNIEELNASLEALGSEPVKNKRHPELVSGSISLHHEIPDQVRDDECYLFSDHDSDAVVSAAGLRMLCGDKERIPPRISWPSMLDKQRAKCEGWIFGASDI